MLSEYYVFTFSMFIQGFQFRVISFRHCERVAIHPGIYDPEIEPGIWPDDPCGLQQDNCATKVPDDVGVPAFHHWTACQQWLSSKEIWAPIFQSNQSNVLLKIFNGSTYVKRTVLRESHRLGSDCAQRLWQLLH